MGQTITEKIKKYWRKKKTKSMANQSILERLIHIIFKK